ncbi:LysR family transcriptional regulator [Spirillospora sp. CA-294931]|uniref:LysR family transcriptional regulator n=1 Tax=Spirillospora sp. CA-294931 TaxID=3240042 RepID=UPI003D934EF4
MIPEVRLLRYFLAVAEESNFTRAAARLHIAQPALSAQIRQLETQLGVRLLERTTRRVTLTEAGRVLQERGPAALAGFEEVWDAARRAGRGELGRLRIAYSASTGWGTVPRLVEAMGEAHPDLDVAAEMMGTPAVTDAVLSGRADLGIARTPEPTGGVRLRTVRSERQGILVSAEHPLAGRAVAETADLAAYPVTMHPREANPAHYDQLVALFERAGVRPRLVERTVAFDPSQRPLRDARSIGIVGEESAEGIADWLRWVPLADPARLLVRLVLPAASPSPAAERFEAVALATARAEGWLDEGSAGRSVS